MPADFHGLSVLALESRRAADMVQLIQRHGGRAQSAPSMREIPLQQTDEAMTFAQRLLSGQVDVVVLMTGVGTRLLTQVVTQRHPLDQFTQALAKVTTVARGPKPVAALRELGLNPTITVPEPNTWQDLLAALDQHCPVNHKRVAVQEYGQTNGLFLQALEQRGAQVLRVPIYQWALPEDLGPLRQAITDLIQQRVDVVLFTSATQVDHLFQVARQEGSEQQLRDSFRRVVIGSVGPIASEAVTGHGLTVDFEPDSPHMTPLVHELARGCADLLRKKRTAVEQGINTNQWKRIDMAWPAGGKLTIEDSVFLKACRRQPTPYTPIWIMRQAGRYQRAYRELRRNVSMLELCKSPQLAAEVTLMAVERLGVDAAIIFADILLVLEPLGLHLAFAKGEGPVIANPLRGREDLQRLRRANASELGYLYEAIRLTRKSLRPDLALIGFAGAPFTIASYLIEGGKSNDYAKTKTLMYRDPQTWHGLMERLTELLIDYLNQQIRAGADAVQLFDSWVGSLCPDDYRQFVMPHVQRLIAGVDRAAPLIHFGTGNPALLPFMKQAGGDVIGLDWRVDLAEAWDLLGHDVAVMGNLDPVVLHTSSREIRARAQAVLDKAAGRPGHIFNLGHGVTPDIPPENVAELVEAVHELSAR